MQCVIFSMHIKETNKEIERKPRNNNLRMRVILLCFMQSFKEAYENKVFFAWSTTEIM